LCQQFEDCTFLKNFQAIEGTIDGSRKIGKSDYGKFLKDSEAVLGLIMTYVCNEHPENCLIYREKRVRAVKRPS